MSVCVAARSLSRDTICDGDSVVEKPTDMMSVSSVIEIELIMPCHVSSRTSIIVRYHIVLDCCVDAAKYAVKESRKSATVVFGGLD